jgi:predicted RNA binding protein YcfA (HicA-like mRNA interferase family)
MKVRDAIKLIESDGWFLAPETLNSIFKQAGLE